MWAIFPNRQAREDIGYTPDIEGGIGPVKLAEGVESEDGRVACEHSWSEMTRDWLEAQGAVVANVLPPDFVIKQTE